MSKMPPQSPEPGPPYTPETTPVTDHFPSPETCLLHQPRELTPALDYLSLVTGWPSNEIKPLTSKLFADVASLRGYVAARGTPQGANDADLARTEHEAREGARQYAVSGNLRRLYALSEVMVEGLLSHDAPQATVGWRDRLNRLVEDVHQRDPHDLPLENVRFGGSYQDMVEDSALSFYEETEAQCAVWQMAHCLLLEDAISARASGFQSDAYQKMLREQREQLRIVGDGRYDAAAKKAIIGRLLDASHTFCEDFLSRRSEGADAKRVRELYEDIDSLLVQRLKSQAALRRVLEEASGTRHQKAQQEQARKDAEWRSNAQPLLDEYAQLAAPWLISKRQIRQAGFLQAKAALMGLGNRVGSELFGALDEGRALNVLGGLRYMRQLCTEGTPDGSEPLTHIRGLLEQEMQLRDRYNALGTPPQDWETQTTFQYLWSVTDWLHDNWPALRGLLRKTTDLSAEQLAQLESVLRPTQGTEQAPAPQNAPEQLTPVERVLRRVGETALAGRVKVLNLKPLSMGQPPSETPAQRQQHLNHKKQEAARQLGIEADRIRGERLESFLNICDEELGPDTEVYIVDRTDIGKDAGDRQLGKLAFRNYLVAVFKFEGDRKGFYAENIVAGDRAGYLFVETPELPWKTALALSKSELQAAGGIQIIHPPNDASDADRQHAQKVRKALYRTIGL